MAVQRPIRQVVLQPQGALEHVDLTRLGQAVLLRQHEARTGVMELLPQLANLTTNIVSYSLSSSKCTPAYGAQQLCEVHSLSTRE